MNDKLQRRVVTLASAWFDFDSAESIANTLLSQYEHLDPEPIALALNRDAVFTSLQLSCVVFYARSFKKNKGMDDLSSMLPAYQNGGWQQLHEDMIKLRDKYFTHSDFDFRSIVVNLNRGAVEDIAVDRFGLSASGIRFSWQQFSCIREMCADRKAILWPEIQELLGRLYPKIGEPYSPVLLNKLIGAAR